MIRSFTPLRLEPFVESREEVICLIEEAIQFDVEGLKEDGLPNPEPHSTSDVIKAHA